MLKQRHEQMRTLHGADLALGLRPRGYHYRGGTVEINESVVSEDRSLKVTLTAFDSARGKGQITLEELSQKRGWFYITVRFGAGGQNQIDYKTWDVYKASTFEITTTVRNDTVASIEIIPVGQS
jgi:hypothetical protein